MASFRTKFMICLLTALALVVTPVASTAQALPGTQGASLTAFTRVAPAEGGFAYDPIPAFGPAMYARLRSSGIDLVRLVVRPLPLMAGTPLSQARARAQVLLTVHQLISARIATIVDIHPWPPDTPEDEARLICTSDGAAALERALLELAKPMSREHGSVALELLNEPKRCRVDGNERWTVLQRQLVSNIRSIAPQLPLVITPSAGQLDDLLVFDPSPYLADPNILFSFHFYDPFIFTTPVYFKTAPVPFPSPGSLFAGTKAFSQADRSKMSAQDSADLWRYLTRPNDENTIARRFAALAGWSKAKGVPASRILLGEYGVVRSADTGSADDYRSSMRWLSAIKREASRNNIRAIFWLWPAKPGFLYDPQKRWIREDAAEAIGVRPGRQ